jgi:hypothetical protein
MPRKYECCGEIDQSRKGRLGEGGVPIPVSQGPEGPSEATKRARVTRPCKESTSPDGKMVDLESMGEPQGEARHQSDRQMGPSDVPVSSYMASC